MSQLPADVLLLICDLLVPRDRFECMTVCHQWHDTIQRHSLFRVIYLNEEERFNQLIEKVKKDPALGARVERIILTFCFDEGYDATIHGDLFPNLRDFTLSTFPDYEEDCGPIKPHQGHLWCEKIEKMADNSSDRNIQTLLISGLCRNLTYIKVTGLESKSVSSFFSALANAPALKTLDIQDGTMTFKDLEMLHENTPLLHSLSISGFTFNALPTPQNIKPATSVKKFHFHGLYFDTYDDFNVHLPYITQKYTCVEDLKLELQNLAHGDDLIDEEIELCANQKAMISSHMRTLAPHLKVLSLWIPTTLHSDNMSSGFDFNILDECGCRIEKLVLETTVKTHILESISRAAQMQYIQSLTVESIDCGGDDEDDDDDESVNGGSTVSFNWLARFIKLKELKLAMYNFSKIRKRCTLDLLDLFMNLNNVQLESLSIRELCLKATDSKTPFVYPSLKKIRLCKVSFEIGIDVWISHTFPNLKHLELDNCFSRGGAIMLPKIDLTYLRIISRSQEQTFPVLLITLGDKVERIYNASRSDSRFRSHQEDPYEDVFTFPPVWSLPLSKSNDVPRLTVICNSVHNFDLINSSLY